MGQKNTKKIKEENGDKSKKKNLKIRKNREKLKKKNGKKLKKWTKLPKMAMYVGLCKTATAFDNEWFSKQSEMSGKTPSWRLSMQLFTGKCGTPYRSVAN